LKKYNLGNHADGIADKDDIEQNIAYAQKHEHQGNFDKAFQLYKEAADKGNAEAQFNVAEYYYKFYNEEIVLSVEDKSNAFKKAAEYYEKAALQDHAKAQYTYYKLYHELKEEKELEDYLNEGLKEEKREHFLDNLISVFDQDKALIYLKRAAEHGNADAQYQLGRCYDYGKGIEKDPEKTFQWYMKASEQGYSKAQYDLGTCYEEGYGTEEKPEEAFKWYMEAAKQGDFNAQYEVGRCFIQGYGTKKMPEKAFKWYMKAAEQDNSDTQYEVGSCYENGYGTEKMPEKAFEWYMKAAEHGNPAAQFELGRYYEKGYGTAKDSAKAFEWYMKAAEQTISNVQRNYFRYGTENMPSRTFFKQYMKARAMYALGDCFLMGIGVQIDFEEAIKWYMKAIENGYGSETDVLGKFYSIIEENPSAIQYYKKIAEELSTDGDAYFNIAEIYYKQFNSFKSKMGKGVAAGALIGASILIPVTNFVTIPAAIASLTTGITIKDKSFLKSEKGQEMIKYYKKAAELGHEEAKKKYEKYKKYLKQG